MEVVVLDLFRWYGLLGEADDACSAAAVAAPADEVRRMSVVMMLGRGMLSLGKKKK